MNIIAEDFNELLDLPGERGEKIAALKTVEFLRERAQGADEDDWDEILALVPNAEPEDYDRPSAPASQP